MRHLACRQSRQESQYGRRSGIGHRECSSARLSRPVASDRWRPGDSMKYPGYHCLCLGVAGVDDALAELRRRGVTVVAEPVLVEEISPRLALLTDPGAK